MDASLDHLRGKDGWIRQKGPDVPQIDAEKHPIVNVVTADGVKFSLPTEQANKSKHLVEQWELLDDKEDEINLQIVNEKTFKECLEFIKMDLEDPLDVIEKPIKTTDLCDIVPD